MKTNDPITIRRVSNGFIVEMVRQPNEAVVMNDIAVFETQAALAHWLADHFEPLPHTPLPPLHPYPAGTTYPV